MTDTNTGRGSVLPVWGEYDTVVCGAGPAGWVAAVSAARHGCRTALIDRYGFMGGTAAGDYVLPISGFYNSGARVAGGIGWEFVGRMEKIGAAQVELPKGHVSYNPEYYKLTAQEMTAEAGVDFISNTFVTGVSVDGGRRVSAVNISNKSGNFAVKGKFFIDATGDADVCAAAGVPMLPRTRDMQPASMCFVLAGVDVTTPLLRDSIHHDGKGGKGSCNEEIRGFLLSAGVENFCGPWFNTMMDGCTVAVNITRTSTDSTDARDFAAAEWRLRRDMFRITELLRRHYPEFGRCTVVASAVNAGVRESRRIRGRYVLTGDDVKSCRDQTCPVAYCAHPMDIHAAKGAGQTLIRLNRAAPIPYDCLTAEGWPNLLAAGRCASMEQEPFASARVQATVMSMGEAAGAAAAFALREGIAADRVAADRCADFEAFAGLYRI